MSRSASMFVTSLALTLALLLPGTAAAASRTKLVVDSTSGQPNAGEPELWTGTIFRDGPRAREIPECRHVSCDRIQVKVKLPDNLWRHHPGGLQIAIRFIAGAPDDNLSLVVYRDDHRIASSTAQIGTAQSVVIPSASNGVYQVYVVDGITFGGTEPNPVIAYEGLTQVVYDAPKRPVRDLLPDLVALPQQNISFGPPFEIFDDPVPTGSSCHQSEIDEDGAQTCLRFDQVLGNVGTGALDIRFDQPAGVPPIDDQEFPTRQRIYRSDGSFYHVPAGNVHWHAIHQHYHFNGFAQSKLWATNVRGGRKGKAPAATGNKVSFCIATTSIHPDYWGQQAFGPSAYPAPDCLAPDSTSGGLDHFKQGMSVGWSDEYNWFLPGQYVEVTGVPNGDYILDTTVDPTNHLVESDKTNNCGSVRVRLSHMGTQNAQAELLGPGPACAPQ
jgi:Lysyl oxidase